MCVYVGQQVHALSVIKHLKAKISSDGVPGTKSHQTGVRGLICVSLGELDHHDLKAGINLHLSYFNPLKMMVDHLALT